MKLATRKKNSIAASAADAKSVADMLSEVPHIQKGIETSRHEGFIKGYEQALKDVQISLGELNE